MLKSGFVFLHLAVVGINVWSAYCLTDEEQSTMIEALKPVVMDCIEECGITEEDFNKEKSGDMNPCFKKCFLKKLGLLTEDGKYDREAVKEQMAMYSDNEEEANKMQKTIDECFKGKEEELKNDKDAEMKRVNLIFDCLKNYKE